MSHCPNRISGHNPNISMSSSPFLFNPPFGICHSYFGGQMAHFINLRRYLTFSRATCVFVRELHQLTFIAARIWIPKGHDSYQPLIWPQNIYYTAVKHHQTQFVLTFATNSSQASISLIKIRLPRLALDRAQYKFTILSSTRRGQTYYHISNIAVYLLWLYTCCGILAASIVAHKQQPCGEKEWHPWANKIWK